MPEPDPIPPARRPSRPAIIAHRGVPRLLPENTLAGFARALADGADGIELDVHLSADGQVVVHHDDSVPVLSPGQHSLALAAEPLARLRAASGAELPTLDEVLELVGGRATVYVELKGARIEQAVLDVIRASHHARCAVHAFDHRAVLRSATLAPELARGILLVGRVVDPVAVMRAAGARTLWQEWTLLDEELVEEVHRSGGEVVAWTVNDVAAALRLAAMNVDAICTDLPGPLRAALHGSD